MSVSFVGSTRESPGRKYERYLELELQPKLQRSRAVRRYWMEECITWETSGGTRREICAAVSVTTYGVASRIPFAGIKNGKLSVVEDIEDFGTKLKRVLFGAQLHASKQRHIEICAVGIVQRIATCTALGQSTGSNEFAGIPQERTHRATIGAGSNARSTTH